MPYTLAKFFLWGLLMACAGGVIGWLLCRLKYRFVLARIRSATTDTSELDRLRGRIANLEAVVAERDRLRIELADVRGRSAGAYGFGSATDRPDDREHVAAVDDREHVAAVDDALADVDPDLAAAATLLGTGIALDDLTVIVGIGPKVAELCSGIGITTWRQLAATDVAQLQLMLDDAGTRFQVHKPETWPRQAELLANGSWTEFKQLTTELGGAS